MAAKKKTVKRKSARSATVRSGSRIHGVDHDFVLIAGGGFVLLILIMIYFYR